MSADILASAAAGELPEWTEATPRRRAHMDRVATLMREWAEALGLGLIDRDRWAAAGRLHDVLRDADAGTLRAWTPDEFRGLPEPFLHGPAAANRLASDGVDDVAVLDAIRYHTLGNDRLAPVGRALIVADFLEPGRKTLAAWRTRQRSRMPAELDEVLAEVVRAKLGNGLDRRVPLRPEMVSLWNTLVQS